MIDWSQLFITALDRHRQGQLDEALSLYRVLLCGTPDHVDAWHNLSIIEFDKSGPSQALPGFIRARRGGIQNLIFWRSNVRGLVLGGYHDAAEDLLRECEESALFHTEEIDDFKDEVDSIIESTELDKLENWMGAKRMSEVVERSSRLVARYPQNAFFWKSLGSARQFLGQSTDAIVALSAALNIERHDFQSLLNRGSAVHDLGSFDLAKDDFERAICLSPENPLCEMNLGVALSRLGYRGDGLARYKRASSLGPKVLECLLTFGVALRETNLNRDARDVFMRILGLDPAFPAALAQYGLTHRESGNTTGACTVFERAILLAPHIADAYGFLGATLSDIASDDVQRARAHRSFLLSLALDPVEPEALNNLGVLLHKMQRRWCVITRIHAAISGSFCRVSGSFSGR
jgi:tetratricopeptide (TPR) repeat protein